MDKMISIDKFIPFLSAKAHEKVFAKKGEQYIKVRIRTSKWLHHMNERLDICKIELVDLPQDDPCSDVYAMMNLRDGIYETAPWSTYDKGEKAATYAELVLVHELPNESSTKYDSAHGTQIEHEGPLTVNGLAFISTWTTIFKPLGGGHAYNFGSAEDVGSQDNMPDAPIILSIKKSQDSSSDIAAYWFSFDERTCVFTFYCHSTNAIDGSIIIHPNKPSVVFGKQYDGRSIPDTLFMNSFVKKVVIADGIKKIGDRAFIYCQKLRYADIAGTVESIGNECFADSALLSVKIPDSVKAIGNGAFHDIYELKSVELPDSITDLQPTCFAGCKSLASIVLPRNLKTLANNVFSRCESLKEICIPAGVYFIGYGCFSSAGLETIKIEHGTKLELSNLAFECTNAKEIWLPNSVVPGRYINGNLSLAFDNLKAVSSTVKMHVEPKPSDAIQRMLDACGVQNVIYDYANPASNAHSI